MLPVEPMCCFKRERLQFGYDSIVNEERRERIQNR